MSFSTISSASPAPTPGPGAFDDGFDAYLGRVRAPFEGQPMFLTNCGPRLFEVYLESFPAEWRQFHNCHACRRFFEQYGDLVVIDDQGKLISALWDREEAPYAYKEAIGRLQGLVQAASVTRMFFSKEKTLGTPGSRVEYPGEGIRDWTHFHVVQKTPFKDRLRTAEQAASAKLHDFQTLTHALANYSLEDLKLAVQLLQSETLYRSNKILGAAEWLLDVKERTQTLHWLQRNHILWLAVAGAPTGFCHPRSGMIGTLLEDITAGLPFEEVKRKFAAKMHPEQYQRPQAAPSAGNIKRGEEIVAKLGIARSLERRFARLDEIETLWKPKEAESPFQSGVFGHLAPKGKMAPRLMEVKGGPITWVKFLRDVLPSAERISIYTPHRGNYCALTTAAHADAPPILQWDAEERRNPVAWYAYTGGSRATDWGLHAGQFTEVTAVAEAPTHWFGHVSPNHAPGALFIMEGCKDVHTNQGNALFPETLKSDLHEIRATIEAYSRSAKLGGHEEASACGLVIRKGFKPSDTLIVEVRAGAASTQYNIDRWE
jgi:hypothetical protein